MKIINKQQVSHINCFKEQKGVYSYWYGYLQYIWMEAEYFKFLWFIKTPIKNYERGYYRDTKRESIINGTPLKIEKEKHFVVGKVVWTKPHIELCLGKDSIHVEHFESYEELEKHLEDNYKDFDIRYE